jgi:ferredoxin
MEKATIQWARCLSQVEVKMDWEKKEADSSNEWTSLGRREFIKGIGLGGGAVLLLGQFGVQAAAWALAGDPELTMVLVDYAKCTGCRTCEAACSSRNRPVSIGGQEVPGLGNPRYANIRVHSFNPDVDVPTVCASCADTPCV